MNNAKLHRFAYLQQQKRSSIKSEKKWLHIFLLGLVIGILLTFFNRKLFIEDQNFFGEDVIKRISYSVFFHDSLFIFVFKKRVFWVILFVLLANTRVNKSFHCCFVTGFGVSFGILMMTAIVKYGFKGLGVFIVMILPQNLIYFPAYYFLIAISQSIYNKKFCVVNEESNSLFKTSVGVGVILIVILLVFGCILESYVNPILIKKYFENFWY